MSSDSKDIFEWRNDPLSRSMSIDNQEVGIEEHNNWFESSLINPSKFLYIGMLLDKKVGICRFDHGTLSGCAKVSINLNPLMRGRNLSGTFLTGAIEKYREAHKVSLTAIVRKENGASVRLFRKSGFKSEGEDETFYTFVLKDNQ